MADTDRLLPADSDWPDYLIELNDPNWPQSTLTDPDCPCLIDPINHFVLSFVQILLYWYGHIWTLIGQRIVCLSTRQEESLSKTNEKLPTQVSWWIGVLLLLHRPSDGGQNKYWGELFWQTWKTLNLNLVFAVREINSVKLQRITLANWKYDFEREIPKILTQPKEGELELV